MKDKNKILFLLFFTILTLISVFRLYSLNQDKILLVVIAFFSLLLILEVISIFSKKIRKFFD
ncbi:MAG: hypothetical protein Q8P15_02110 [Nanoarchaeota archaeon]|nr:hypothetical protein [Nanoarchaeota archaeon]